jgi:hypothetical protein
MSQVNKKGKKKHTFLVSKASKLPSTPDSTSVVNSREAYSRVNNSKKQQRKFLQSKIKSRASIAPQPKPNQTQPT